MYLTSCCCFVHFCEPRCSIVAAVDGEELRTTRIGGPIGFVPVARPVAAPVAPRAARHQSVERAIVTQQHHQQQQSQQHHKQQPIANKAKGLRRFLGKMRRANSGTIHDENAKGKESSNGGATNGGGGGGGGGASSSGESGHLRRGGFRASAGSKFASWMGPPGSGLPLSGAQQASSGAASPTPDHSKQGGEQGGLPFRQWKVETICSWLDHLGLYMYNAEVRKHVKLGEQLLALSSHDLEHKLGMRSSLHRKKVLLALQAKQDPSSIAQDLPGKLDHQWVVRWLDDVGLPQYKDAFLEARVDGRVLNFLTAEDLFQMRVTNLLHHLSVRRGIQVLRQSEFEPSCLRRRAASPEERDRTSAPPEVALWTNHRVMEWLRAVDLAEYAPNLRGSGVHGALLVLEPRFTPDLLASLLSIPPAKTLLRRHLALHFRDLVGSEAMKDKRSAEDEPGYQVIFYPSSYSAHYDFGQLLLVGIDPHGKGEAGKEGGSWSRAGFLPDPPEEGVQGGRA